MTNKVQKYRSRMGARNTLYLDQNDAAYWLAAENFVDDDEECDVDGLYANSPQRKMTPNERSRNIAVEARAPVTLSMSQKRPMKTHLLQPPNSTCPMPPNSSNSPSSKSGWSFESNELFASPRRAPPTPKMAPQEKIIDMTSPISPVSPIPSAYITKTSSPSLLPPINIGSFSNERLSPRLSPRFSIGFDKFGSKKQLNSSIDARTSTQTFSSSSSNLTSIEPSQVGTAIISSFPTPPQREGRARMIDFNEIRRRGMGSVSPTKEKDLYFTKSSRPISKPLPPPPLSREDFESDYDDDDSFDGLYAESVPDSSTDMHSQGYSGMNGIHRPLCPYADHSDVSTDHCGCRMLSRTGPYQMQNSNGLACTSAPDLLDLLDSCKQLEQKKKQDDMRRAKDVLYRLSNEIHAMEKEQKRMEGDKSLIKKTKIKFALPENNQSSFELSRLNQNLPSRPNDIDRLGRDKLLPTTQHLEGSRSISPGPSYGLAAGMLHACLSPTSPTPPNDLAQQPEKNKTISAPEKSSVPVVRPKRSFDMLKRFRSDSPIPATTVTRKAYTPSPPFGPSRQMISTVRSHDRWNSNSSTSSSGHSAGQQESVRRILSPTGRQNASPYQWDSPWQEIRSQKAVMANEISRHHRQTSSKSSSASGSTFTSNNGSIGTPNTTVDSVSIPSTPIRSKLHAKGQPSMCPIIETNKDGISSKMPYSPVSNNTPLNNSRSPKTFRRQKQDLMYFEQAIEPFPLEVKRKEFAPPLPPPLPKGHRLLKSENEKRMKEDKKQSLDSISRSNSDQQNNNNFGFAL